MQGSCLPFFFYAPHFKHLHVYLAHRALYWEPVSPTNWTFFIAQLVARALYQHCRGDLCNTGTNWGWVWRWSCTSIAEATSAILVQSEVGFEDDPVPALQRRPLQYWYNLRLGLKMILFKQPESSGVYKRKLLQIVQLLLKCKYFGLWPTL